MKKIIIFLMAATMVIGFSGISFAADTCETCIAPGTIDRACPIEEQGDCYSEPFDYEDAAYDPNYCTDPKAPRRVIFPACDCENFVEGDYIDIRMEILVNGLSGDNGAYWAQNVNSIDVGTYSSSAAACDDGLNYDGDFLGPFEYLYYDSQGDLETGSPLTGGYYCESIGDSNRVTVIQPDADLINTDCLEHGYMITAENDLNNEAYWAINIPYIRFDQNMVQAGDVIEVRICLAKAIVDTRTGGDFPCEYPIVDLGGICDDPACCCTFEVGTLGCCLEDLVLGGKLIYPYATEMNNATWWYGMVITNISDEDGVADVTVYETDGDTATISVDVAANNMFVTNNQALMAAFGGDIGDARAYFEVNCDFTASGFLFIGNDDKAEAMGYLPVSRPIFDYLAEMIESGQRMGSIIDLE